MNNRKQNENFQFEEDFFSITSEGISILIMKYCF